MTIEAHLLAERSVPRYTSYPTAPHFSPNLGAETYSSWLLRLPSDATLSLYIHVPFCRELCLYCGCHTKAVRQRPPVDDYAIAVKAEITGLGQYLKRQRVFHWHWGGGTPSMLRPEQLIAITDEVARVFDPTALREHAIELDPRYVTRDLVGCLSRIGVNRVSLGVQDLSPDVQHAIGRIQPYETVARAVDLLRGAGIAGINIDLMYGLPRQTSDNVRSTAEQICVLKPQRIALFGYAHVPWFKRQQRLIDPAQLPDAAARLEQMGTARAVFLSFGYEEIGFDHFAVPDDGLAIAARAGALHRNFQGYTTDDATALIGIGASAIGRLPEGFVQNAPDIGGYSRSVRSGNLATVRGIALSSDDRIRAAVIERIMCELRVDLREFAAPTTSHGFESEIESLKPLAAEGLVQLEAALVRVTERGRPYLRLVAAAFDSYLAANAGSHSRAV